MFAFLEGKIVEKRGSEVLLNVSGMGFSVQVPLETAEALPDTGDVAFLWTYTYFGEKELKIFGFSTKRELELFKTIIQIPKVGPQVALSIISHLGYEGFLRVVEEGDVSSLKKVPRVGEKTAKRIISELRDVVGRAVSDSVSSDVVEALKSLGYTEREIAGVLKAVKEKDRLSDEQLLKECLRILGDRAV